MRCPFSSCCTFLINTMLINKLTGYFTLSKLFTLICVILTAFLMLEVVLEFAVIKPTSTSEEQVEFNSKIFPDIVVCVDPSISMNRSEKYGYHSTHFYRGGSKGGKFIGWNGIDGETNSSDILNEVLNLKMNLGLLDPYGAYYKDKKGEIWKSQVQLKDLLFPYGRCLLIKPKTNESVSLKKLFVSPNKDVFLNLTEGSPVTLKVFMMDPINSPLIYPMNFQMNGDHIKIHLDPMKNDNISWLFTVKVSQSYHVQGDPLFDCTDYTEKQRYGDCVWEELSGMFEQRLNCIPPLLALKPDQMCNRRFNMTENESTEIFQLFWNNYLNFEPSLCKKPCTHTSYEVQLKQVMEVRYVLIGISFETIVEVTRSRFSTNFMSLLTSLGGSVGQPSLLRKPKLYQNIIKVMPVVKVKHCNI